jgi:hypothetical protein
VRGVCFMGGFYLSVVCLQRYVYFLIKQGDWIVFFMHVCVSAEGGCLQVCASAGRGVRRSMTLRLGRSGFLGRYSRCSVETHGRASPRV